MARGGPNREANQDSEAARRVRIGSSDPNHKSAGSRFARTKCARRVRHRDVPYQSTTDTSIISSLLHPNCLAHPLHFRINTSL